MVLILVAFAMTAVLIVAALVLDIGNVRNTRQSNRSAADFATTAGLQGMQHDDGVPRPWAGACAALEYLAANTPGLSLDVEFTDGDGDPVLAPDPCTLTTFLDLKCGSDPDTWAWIHGEDGQFTVDIKSAYVTPDADFDEDATIYAGDDGSHGGCDQIAVIINDVDSEFFGSIAGADDYETRIRSVGRVDIGESRPVSVALVLLEQVDCQALNFQGGAGGTGRVTVRGDGDQPGIIHADSDGSGDACGEQVINGKNNGGNPLVRALSAPSAPSTHGIISTYHQFLGGTNGAQWTSTRSAVATEVWLCDPDHPTGDGPPVTECTTGPTGNERATRKTADDHYLSDVTDLRTDANAVFNNTGNVRADQYTTYSSLGVDDCALEGGGDVPHEVRIGPDDLDAGKPGLYIDCDLLEIKNNWTLVIEDGVDHVAFRGAIGFAGNGVLDIQDPSRVYVQNQPASGSPAAAAIDVTALAAFRVNALGVTSCADRPAAETTELVIRAGALDVQGGGDLQLCSTFVHLMGGDATPAPVSLASPYPAPRSNTQTGSFDIAGGGIVEWTAPNTVRDQPPSIGSYAFEDLAVWTETQADSVLRGGGDMELGGIFFLPNCGPESGIGGFTIAGSSGGTINFDAQLWTRKLSHQGGANFVMRANPDDSLPLPFFASTALVR